MNKLIVVLVVVAATGLVISACGDDKNECEKFVDIHQDAWDGYCDDRSAECWACDCYNQGLVAEPTGSGTQITWTCVAPYSEPTCDGTYLEHAQTCLEDKALCEQQALATATSFCNNTRK